nr:MAG TPA: hypothetical protein [Caudoviricetes sp.]
MHKYSKENLDINLFNAYVIVGHDKSISILKRLNFVELTCLSNILKRCIY